MVKERSHDGDQIRGDTLDKQLFAVKIRSRVLHVRMCLMRKDSYFSLRAMRFHNNGLVHAVSTPTGYIPKECSSVDLHATNHVETVVGKESQTLKLYCLIVL